MTFREEIHAIAAPDYYHDGIADLMREVEGMSAMRCLATLQAAMRHAPPDGRYLEVGAYKGLSARAAMLGNESKHFTVCETFEERPHWGDYRSECIENLKAANCENLMLVEGDGIEYMRQTPDRYDVVYYDGNHSYAHTLAAMSVARYVLKAGGVFFLDDTNYAQVRAAMLTGARDFGYTMIADFWTPSGAHETWWNGWTIFTRGAHD